MERETCYSSHELVNLLVINWFKDKLQTMTIGEATCYYNLGIKINTCDYYTHYLALK